uniref:ORF2a n=1 Tax=Torque teno virus TaxID=68887 RepID=A0A5B8NIU8_9VIRU|nr:ORF2a [Torque teno virus]
MAEFFTPVRSGGATAEQRPPRPEGGCRR